MLAWEQKNNTNIQWYNERESYPERERKWYNDITILWYYKPIRQWEHESMTAWQHESMTAWQHERTKEQNNEKKKNESTKVRNNERSREREKKNIQKSNVGPQKAKNNFLMKIFRSIICSIFIIPTKISETYKVTLVNLYKAQTCEGLAWIRFQYFH